MNVLTRQYQKLSTFKCVKYNCINKLGNFKFLCQKNVDVSTNVIKDVILFKYDNPRFFRLMNIFSLCQFGFWAYLSVFAYTTLRDAPVEHKEGLPWWQRINLGENKYRNAIGVFSFLTGYGILSISWIYTLRSVRYLILRKGGNDLTLVTYTPFGTNRIVTVPLKYVNCKEMRNVAKYQLPLKVRGHYFHYVLDMKGEFKNPHLFDHTAGLRRNIKNI